MQTHPTALVRLDRAQRAAIRREIWIIASGIGDIELAFDEDLDERLGREFVLAWIERLQRLVAMLDAIEWREPESAPEQHSVTVDSELADWARTRAAELKRTCHDVDEPGDEDLDALSAFTLIGEAV